MSGHKIFVDRRYGGLGDLMMISRSLLKMTEGGNVVSLFVESQWRPLFDRSPLNLAESPNPVNHKWVYKLHDPCPAGWIETTECVERRSDITHRTSVYSDRVSIFALAMGVWLEMEERTPYVWLHDKDYQKARTLIPSGQGPLIYIQLNSAESYRDWKSMYALIPCLKEKYPDVRLMCYNKTPIDGVTTFQTDVLTSIALIGLSDLVISPDSMAVHAASALGVPCVAIYGPISAETRVTNYPFCSAVCADLPCMSCWRNATDLCEYKQTESSFCLDKLSHFDILTEVEVRLAELSQGQKVPLHKYKYV